mgnify:CR=1 FL=1
MFYEGQFTGHAALQTLASRAWPSALAASSVYRWLHCPSSWLAVAAYSVTAAAEAEGDVVALADSACWQCEGLLLTHGSPLG